MKNNEFAIVNYNFTLFSLEHVAVNLLMATETIHEKEQQKRGFAGFGLRASPSPLTDLDREPLRATPEGTLVRAGSRASPCSAFVQLSRWTVDDHCLTRAHLTLIPI